MYHFKLFQRRQSCQKLGHDMSELVLWHSLELRGFDVSVQIDVQQLEDNHLKGAELKCIPHLDQVGLVGNKGQQSRLYKSVFRFVAFVS
jgi:hypothetical protein